MNTPGPSTPVGTKCLFIGPTSTSPERVGTVVSIFEHLPDDLRQMVCADLIVQADSDGQYAGTLYDCLMLLGPDDPDGEQRITERERETC